MALKGSSPSGIAELKWDRVGKVFSVAFGIIPRAAFLFDVLSGTDIPPL
jgi:hypothetical protein